MKQIGGGIYAREELCPNYPSSHSKNQYNVFLLK